MELFSSRESNPGFLFKIKKKVRIFSIQPPKKFSVQGNGMWQEKTMVIRLIVHFLMLAIGTLNGDIEHSSKHRVFSGIISVCMHFYLFCAGKNRHFRRS